MHKAETSHQNASYATKFSEVLYPNVDKPHSLLKEFHCQKSKGIVIKALMRKGPGVHGDKKKPAHHLVPFMVCRGK